MPLYHWVAIGKVEFGMLGQMTLETRLRLISGVYDQPVECRSSACFHMQAARAMAGLAARVDAICPSDRMKSRVYAAGKFLGNRLMTGRAGLRSHKLGALDGRWGGELRPGVDARYDQVRHQKHTKSTRQPETDQELSISGWLRDFVDHWGVGYSGRSDSMHPDSSRHPVK